jgi:hypothetical protein
VGSAFEPVARSLNGFGVGATSGATRRPITAPR